MHFDTSFNYTENPISDGGNWLAHNQLTNTVVKTDASVAGGIAACTQDGSGGFNDSYAYVNGVWAPDQSGAAKIHLAAGITGIQEVEVLLRVTDSATFTHAYECNLAVNGAYCQVVRWETGGFTVLADTAHGLTVNDGSVLFAQMIGSTIKVFLDGVLVNTVVDTMWTTGNPGMAFYRKDNGGFTDPLRYAISHYTANDVQEIQTAKLSCIVL